MPAPNLPKINFGANLGGFRLSISQRFRIFGYKKLIKPLGTNSFLVFLFEESFLLKLTCILFPSILYFKVKILVLFVFLVDNIGLQ